MSEWIKASDELPEQGKHLYFTRHGACDCPITVYGYRLGVHWQDQMHNLRIHACEVFEWQYMPLPEPPKPEGPFRACGVACEVIKITHCDGSWFFLSQDNAKEFGRWLNMMWKRHKCK